MPAVVHRLQFKEQFLRPVFLELGSSKGIKCSEKQKCVIVEEFYSHS